jgi:hypothetical protein
MIRFFKLLWFDVSGFFHIRNVVRKNKDTVDFQRLGLRVDWVYRIYTVVNPSEEDKGDSPEVLRIKAQNKMLPIHRYVEKLGLSEYVSVSVEQIPDASDPEKLSDSYLLVYYPIMNIITTFKVVVFFSMIFAVMGYLAFF